MTALLASVTDPQEARSALAGGADLIDLKDPARGALGALPVATVREVAETVAGRAPVSATVGDPPMVPDRMIAAVRQRAAAGADIVKVALSADEEAGPSLRALGSLADEGIAVVVVLFADEGPDRSWIQSVAEARLAGIMLDTAGKGAASLRQLVTDGWLAAFVEMARAQGLMVGLAGSLQASDAAPLAALDPDYVGFRGALCRGGDRTAALDPEALAGLRARIASTRTGVEAVAPGAGAREAIPRL